MLALSRFQETTQNFRDLIRAFFGNPVRGVYPFEACIG